MGKLLNRKVGELPRAFKGASAPGLGQPHNPPFYHVAERPFKKRAAPSMDMALSAVAARRIGRVAGMSEAIEDGAVTQRQLVGDKDLCSLVLESKESMKRGAQWKPLLHCA